MNYLTLLLFTQWWEKGAVANSNRPAGWISPSNLIERNGEHNFSEAGLLPTALTRSAGATGSAALGVLQTAIVLARNKCFIDIRVSYLKKLFTLNWREKSLRKGNQRRKSDSFINEDEQKF